MSAQCQHGLLRYECWKCDRPAKEPIVTMTERQALKLTREIDEARRIFKQAVDERNELIAERNALAALLRRMREDCNLDMRLWQWRPAIDAALPSKN
jgi:hypothetical protein